MNVTTVDRLTSDNLSNQIKTWSQIRFTGRLDVRAGSVQQWSLYFCQGRLLWALGGCHWHRRWHRLLLQHCPKLDIQAIRLGATEIAKGGDYDLLRKWVDQKRLTGEQVSNIIHSTVAEVLFDILQVESTCQLEFISDRHDTLNTHLTSLNSLPSLTQAQDNWQKWSHAGLARLSPNQAPILRQLRALQQQTSIQVYQTLVKVVDGQKTLRDLALLLQQDLLVLSRTLTVYTRRELMELVSIPDLLLPAAPPTQNSGTKASSSSAFPAPLIACIDDSLSTQQVMKQILTKFGCRFTGIQDSVQALPTLLEHQPDLIFLDLVMPIANGYEICSQIRRISQFKNTPVVIVTGNDGIVDRVRAKVAGSTDFLVKPIEAERVLAILQKYLVGSKLRTA